MVPKGSVLDTNPDAGWVEYMDKVGEYVPIISCAWQPHVCGATG